MVRDWVLNALRVGIEAGQLSPNGDFRDEYLKEIARFLDENPAASYSDFTRRDDVLATE